MYKNKSDSHNLCVRIIKNGNGSKRKKNHFLFSICPTEYYSDKENRLDWLLTSIPIANRNV